MLELVLLVKNCVLVLSALLFESELLMLLVRNLSC